MDAEAKMAEHLISLLEREHKPYRWPVLAVVPRSQLRADASFSFTLPLSGCCLGEMAQTLREGIIIVDLLEPSDPSHEEFYDPSEHRRDLECALRNDCIPFALIIMEVADHYAKLTVSVEVFPECANAVSLAYMGKVMVWVAAAADRQLDILRLSQAGLAMSRSESGDPSRS